MMKEPSIRLSVVACALLAAGGSASAARRYVNINLTTGANTGSSWANAYRDADCLDDANAAAVSGDEIWVARGTYKPTIRSNVNDPRSVRYVFKPTVAYYGGFAGNETTVASRNLLAMRTNPTVLSADLAGDDAPISAPMNVATYSDNARQLVFVDDMQDSALIDGFTFVGANSDIAPVPLTTATGALGIDEDAPPSPAGSIATIRNCQFLRNRCTTDGGAAIRFRSGGGNSERGRLLVVSCFFSGNQAPGQTGGAVKVDGFTEGHAFLQCVFTGNTAAGGAAAAVNLATFTNCTIRANASTGALGAITDPTLAGSLILQNCIVSANSRNAGVVDALAQFDNATSTFTCTDGVPIAGTGNISASPYFTDPDGPDDVVGTLDDDLRLAYAPVVSCVDTGNNAVNPNPPGILTLALPATDIAGRLRIADGNLLGPVTVDMGAYEMSAGGVTGGAARVWTRKSGPTSVTSPQSWHAGLPAPTGSVVINNEYDNGFEPAMPQLVVDAPTTWRGMWLADAHAASMSIGAGQLLTLANDSSGLTIDGNTELTVDGDMQTPRITINSGAPSSVFDALAPVHGLAISGPASAVGVASTFAGSGNVTGSGTLLVDSARLSCQTLDGISQLDIIGPLPPGFSSNVLVQQTLAVTNKVLITSGGVLSSRSANVLGRVTIDGVGSRWTVPFFLVVDSGQIIVRDGGSISTGYGAFLFPEGWLRGDGIATSDVVNFGILDPGVFDDEASTNGRGTLTIQGDYEQLGTIEKFGTDSGQLLIDVEYRPDNPEFDRVIVGGEASLGGGLIVGFFNGFRGLDAPVLGTRMEILQASSLPNAFDVAYFPAFSADPEDPRFFRLEYANPAQAGVATVTLVVDSLASLVDLSSAQNFSVTGSPNDAALGDLDGDGDLDLAVTVPDANPANNGRLLLLFNQTNAGASFGGFQLGALEYATGREPSAVAIAPIDAGAGVEIVVANAGDDNVRVYTNNGFGVFAPGAVVSVGDRPLDVDAADLDGDGDQDLVATNNGSNDLSLVFNNGVGAFPSPAGVVAAGDEPVDSEPVDLDNDKDLDIVTGNFGGSSVSASVNDGDGDFPQQSTYAMGSGPVRVIVAALDNSPFPEIITTDLNGGTVSILRATGALQYAPSVQLPVGASPRSVAAIDLDSDGDLDLAIVADDVNVGPAVQVLRNDSPPGQLAIAAATAVQAGADPVLVLAGDVDGSGDEDLVTVNDSTALAMETGMDNDVSIFLNAMPPPECAGDSNGDNQVNGADLSVLLGQFGQSVTPGTGADFNGDGFVNGADLSVLLGRFGTAC